MKPQPQDLWSSAQIRAVDRFSIDERGIPGYELMRRAAQAALDGSHRHWPAARRLAVLCGRGNNGGDGYVFARLARAAGWSVVVGAVADPTELGGDAARAYADWRQAGGVTERWAAALASQPDLIVDAVLGIGLTRDVQGEYARAIDAMNAAGTPILALDVPSGLDADTGAVRGTAVAATRTITFIGDKAGHWLGEGPNLTGWLHVEPLALTEWPERLGAPSACSIEAVSRGPLLARRPRAAHKGRFGHVLVLGGGLGMPGAVQLAAAAALRVGAGLVSVATRPEHAAALACARPELMVSGIATRSDLVPLVARATVLAVGPGLGKTEWSDMLWTGALQSGRPMVVDADALNLLAVAPQNRADWVLTPHPGEAARLLSRDTREVQANRLQAVADLQAKFGGTVVLKGAGTLVRGPIAPPAVCKAGNPGLAQGGMGDVLTGVIAGLLAQFNDGFRAALAGVWAHATAGDRAALQGERGLSASDVIEALRASVNPS